MLPNATLKLTSGVDLVLFHAEDLHESQIRHLAVSVWVDVEVLALLIPELIKNLLGLHQLRSLMLAMDVPIAAKREQLIVNSESPNVAKVLLM